MKDEYVVVHLNKDVRLEHSSTSKGNQIKWFLDESYYKADSFGYEGLAEWVVSKFSEAIVDLSYTPYNCCLIEEDGCQYNGCYSKSFLKEDESFISFAHILELKYLDYSKHIKSGFLRIAKEEVLADMDVQPGVYVMAGLNGGKCLMINTKIGDGKRIQKVVGADFFFQAPTAIFRTSLINWCV